MKSYSVPSDFRADLHDEALRAEFTDGMGWMDGRKDGWMDETGYQKCPSMFFVLCGNVEHVYIYTCIRKKKLSPTFLWVSKFDVKLGVGFKILKFTAGR